MTLPQAMSAVHTIAQTAKLRPAFSLASLRNIRFHAFDRRNSRGDLLPGNGSGEMGVWLQVGRKLLVDLNSFDHWVASHKAEAAK